MVEAAPAAACVVAEADLLFQFQIVAFDPPAQLGLIDQALERVVGGQRAKPVMVRLCFTVRPRPELGRGDNGPSPGRQTVVVGSTPTAYASPSSLIAARKPLSLPYVGSARTTAGATPAASVCRSCCAAISGLVRKQT
jgi:hypothetical protein